MPPQQPIAITQRRSLDAVSIWALVVTLAAAMFIFVPSSIPLETTKAFLLAAGTLITLALYILARLGRGNIIFPPFALVGALWLPAVAYILSATFSGVSFTNALWGSALESDTLGFMLVAAGLGTLAALLLRRPEHYHFFLRALAWMFGGVVLVQTLIIIVGQFAPNTVSPSFSIVGSFGDLAFFLGLGIIGILISLRELELSKRMYRALIGSGVVALVLLAVANSSLVWALLALVSLGLFVEAVMRRSSKTGDADLDEIPVIDETPLETEERSHSRILPLAVLAVSLFFLIGGTLNGALANTLHVNILSVRPSWSSTYSIAQKTYTTTPFFGTGPGTFGIEWLKYRNASLNSTIFWNVNFPSGIGFIPTSFVTTGLAGVLAWISFLALLILFGLRLLVLRAPQDPFVRYVAILSFVASLYLFSIALFNVPNAVVLVLAFVCAGLFISTTRYGAGGRQWGVIFARSPRLGFVIVFMLTILLLASVVAAYTLAERYIAATEFTKANTALSAGNLDQADQAAQNSISFAPNSLAYQIEASVALARLGQIAVSSTMSPTAAQQAYQTTLSSGINAALTATNLDPSNYQHWLVLGSLYAQAVPLGVSGAYASAKTAYEKAQMLNPTNPEIPYILAQLDIANKDTKAAKDDLKAAIALKQDYTAAIFLLSQLEVNDGNVKDALAAALAAAYFEPNNPSILFQVGILSAAEGDLIGAAQALSGAVTVNPQFANARYFLSAVYAKRGNMQEALVQMKAIAAMSSENANAVITQLAALEADKNPFPANLLSLPTAPVE